MQLSYLPQTLRLIWAAAPGWTLAWVTLLVVQGVVPVAVVSLTRTLVDGVVAIRDAGGSIQQAGPVLWLAALMAMLLLLGEFLQGLSEWIRTAQSELIQDHIAALIHRKSVAVDLAFYESPDFHDHLYRALSDANSRPQALLESGGSLLQNSITLLAMALVLVPYGVWLPLALLGSTLPALYTVLRYNWQSHQWWAKTTTDRRRTVYYNLMLTTPEGAAEVRQFGLGRYFQSSFQRLRTALRIQRLDLIKSASLSRLFAGAIGLAVSGGTLVWMIWSTIQGRFTLGDLALFYQAFQRGQTLMRSLLGNVGQIYANSLFLADLFQFLGLKPKVVDPPDPKVLPAKLSEGIRFHQVTFRYPGSDRVSLQDFNLTVPAGQMVAVVGANGAGKSTLAKLLCRFHDPELGQITVDGIDIRNFPLAAYRRMISCLFQTPVAYQATAAQNIAFGDLDSNPNSDAIEKAARQSGAHEIIAQLPQGYDTSLGKWFKNGSELSAGEWQRVAMARAFFRTGPILLLDEPTSFMDSWAESEWLEHFRRHANGRTAIVITHRFTVAMRADVIHVMDRGRIVESGSHVELLKRGGLYAASWRNQTDASSGVSHPALVSTFG